MKKALIFTSLIFITYTVLSQIHQCELKQLSSSEWLLDSTYHACDEYGDQRMYKVLKRNNYGFPLLEQRLNFNFETNEYEVEYKGNYSYINENDSNRYNVTKVYTYNNTDSLHYYIDENDNGYYSEEYNRWFNDNWSNAKKKKESFPTLSPTYHNIRYYKPNETEDWKIVDENKADYNNDSSILFEYKFSGYSTMDTTFKSFTYYNEDQLAFLEEQFRKEDQTWYLKKRIETFYNENQLADSIIEKGFYSGEFRNDDKTIMKYDEYGFLSSYQTFNWDKDLNIWKYDDRDDFINDSLGNVLTEISYRNIADTVWEIRKKLEHTYNDNNKLKETEKFYFSLDNTWKEASIIYYTHHSDQYYSYEKLFWDTTLNSYINGSKFERIIDEYERLIETKIYDAETSDYSWRETLSIKNEFIENEIQFIKKESHFAHLLNDTIELNIWYYNKLHSAIIEMKKNEYILTPNPCKDFLYVQSEIYNSQNINYEIYNITGNLLVKGQLNRSGNIDFSIFAPGSYLLKIFKPNGKTETHKFQKI